MEEAKDSTQQIRMIISRLAIFLSIFFSIFITPTKFFLHVPESFRGLLFASFLIIYWTVTPKTNRLRVSFTKLDFAWLLLVAYSFISVTWATNTYAAVHGSFISFLLYLYFKTFQSQELTTTFKKYFQYTVLAAFVLALLSEFSLVFIQQINSSMRHFTTGRVFGTNFNYISCLIVLLFPFVLFHDFRRFWIFKMAIVAITLITVYFSNSAMAFLVALGLVVAKVFFQLVKNQNTRRLILSGFVLLFISGIFIFQNVKINGKTNYIVKEFSTQNDRLLLSENTLDLMYNSPLLGFGKSNWLYNFGEAGYENYVYFSKKILAFTRYNHAHNILIEKISELGILGAIPLAALILIITFRLIARSKDFTDFDRQIIYALVAYFSYSMVYGVSYNNALKFNFLPIFVSILLGIIMSKNHPSSTDRYFFDRIILIFSIAILSFFSTHYYSQVKFNEGKRFFKNNKYELSLNAFKASNLFIKKSEANYWLGETNWKLGNKEEAINNFESSISQDPFYLKYTTECARYKALTGDCISALQLTNRSKKLLSTYLGDELTKIICLYEVERLGHEIFDAAIADYKKVLQTYEMAYRKYPDSRININRANIYRIKLNQLDNYLRQIGRD